MRRYDFTFTTYFHIALIKNVEVQGHKIPGHISMPQTRSYNPYPMAFPYGNGMVLHFYQQQEGSTTKTVHKVINKGLKTYV